LPTTEEAFELACEAGVDLAGAGTGAGAVFGGAATAAAGVVVGFAAG